jgi:hypothetical protein
MLTAILVVNLPLLSRLLILRSFWPTALSWLLVNWGSIWNSSWLSRLYTTKVNLSDLGDLVSDLSDPGDLGDLSKASGFRIGWDCCCRRRRII